MGIGSTERPTYILGRSTRTQADPVQWFRDPDHSVFCFPNNSLGPDLILLLQLLDGGLLRVLVQFKHLSDPTIDPKATEDAFRTTDPNQFLSNKTRAPVPDETTAITAGKNKGKGIEATLSKWQELKEALDNLEPKVAGAGQFSILRVVILTLRK